MDYWLNAWKWSHSVASDSLQPHGLLPIRLLQPWDFPGKSTGVGCHFLLQGISLTRGLNPGLLRCRQTLYHLSHILCTKNCATEDTMVSKTLRIEMLKLQWRARYWFVQQKMKIFFKSNQAPQLSYFIT